MDNLGAPEKKDSHIKREVDRLHDNVDVLANIICELENRLTAVLSPNTPASANKAEEEVGYNIPLAEELRVINKKLEAMKFHRKEDVMSLTFAAEAVYPLTNKQTVYTLTNLNESEMATDYLIKCGIIPESNEVVRLRLTRSPIDIVTEIVLIKIVEEKGGEAS